MLNIQIKGEDLVKKINEIANWYSIDKEKILRRAIEKYYDYHKEKRAGSVSTFRWELRKKQKALCYYCNLYMSNKDTTVDHKIPYSRGGSSERDNLVACHDACNNAKGDMTVQEFYAFQRSSIPDLASGFKRPVDNSVDTVDNSPIDKDMHSLSTDALSPKL